MSTSTALELAPYASEAASLFNNMKLPATIIAGALVPLGLLAPIPIKSSDSTEKSKVTKAMRIMYTVVAVLSLISELLSVMWSTVAVNKLIETSIKPATSVWHVISRDCNLAWAGTNAHFVAGMMGFMYLIGTRAYFQAGRGMLGRSVAGLTLSGLMLMVAIVNRGVAAGSGDGISYGASVLHLMTHYARLLFKQATKARSVGPLEIAALLGFAFFSFDAIRAVWIKANEKDE